MKVPHRLERHLRRLRKHITALPLKARLRYIAWQDGDIPPQNPDYAFMSYPKSGRTWVRFMLARALQYHYQYKTDRYFLLNSRLYNKLTGKRIMVAHYAKKHSRHEIKRVDRNDKAIFKDVHVFLLTRDIRDTVVSHYYHNRGIERNHAETLSEFLRLPKLGIQGLLNYYAGWYEAQDIPKTFTRVYYASLRKNTFDTLRKIADCQGMAHISDEALHTAIADGQINHMRTLEKEGRIEHLNTRIAASRESPHSGRIRKGIVDGYKEELSADDLAYIDAMIAHSGLPPEWVYYKPTVKNSSAAPKD